MMLSTSHDPQLFRRNQPVEARDRVLEQTVLIQE
jgi:hypothetical protein